MVAASRLSGIPLGRQALSKENITDDQLRLPGSSGLHSGAGALCGEGLEMWGERKEAQQAAKDKVGEAGLGG